MKQKPGRKRALTDIDELAPKASVRTWLRGLSEGDARQGALYALGRYLRWRRARGLEADPDRLIEDCLNGTVRTVSDHEKALLDYFEDASNANGGKKATLVRYYKAVRSFYAANMIALPRAKLRIKSNDQDREVEVRVTATDFLQFVKTVLSDGRLTVRDRAIILTMLQSGQDAGTLARVFNHVAFPQLVKHFGTEDFRAWDPSRCPIRVDLIRPKSDYRYYTFLDVDALDATKAWLEARESRFGKMTIKQGGPKSLASSDPIFVRYDGKGINSRNVTRIFAESGKRARVNRNEGVGGNAPASATPFTVTKSEILW